MQRRRFLSQLGLLCATALGGAAQAEGEPLAPVLRHYGAMASAVYGDTLAGARALQRAVDRFAQAPSADRLAAAREAWLAARRRYALTEALRFYGGPIDGLDGPEPRINAWPVDETFIEALIGRPAQPLDKPALRRLNGLDGEQNVSTGWHAIEFLLWGPDRRADGPGDRPHTDFIDGQAPAAERRRRYLRLSCALLVDELGPLVQAWAPGRANYRRGFEQGERRSLAAVVTGLGALSRGELAGERLEVPLASRDQEDEQSCFSDSTGADVIGDVRGIAAFWHGRLPRADGTLLQGPGVAAWVAGQGGRAAELAGRIGEQIAAALAAAEALHAPFDQEIIGDDTAPGRQRVRLLITALIDQSASLQALARELGLPRVASGRRA